MLTAELVTAVKIKLADGVEAVFVQQGGEWNTLTELRCVSPKALEGGVIITAPDLAQGGRMTSLFKDIFGIAGQRIVVMASPSLVAALKSVESTEAAAGSSTEG